MFVQESGNEFESIGRCPPEKFIPEDDRKNVMHVSLIIPNRNNSRFLRQCLESAQAQTRKFAEIIVVDDASDDDSVQLVRSMAAADQRIKLITLEQQGGVAAARDVAMHAVSTSHVSTLDSDDYFWSRQKNERECELIEHSKSNRPVIAFSDVRWISAAGQEMGSLAVNRRVFEGAVFWPLLLLRGFVPRDFTFSREAYFRAGGYDPAFELYEDWDLKLRLSRLCDFRYSGGDGVAYRRSGTGLSSAGLSKHFYYMLMVVRKNTLALPMPCRCAVRMAAYLRILWFQRGPLKMALMR